MCDQCVACVRTICQPIKGWKLVHALRDGLWTIRGDDYGLVELAEDQDIDVVIPAQSKPCLPAVTWAEYIFRDDRSEEFDNLMYRVATFECDVFGRSKLNAFASLVAASLADGWDPEKDGEFSWWLYARLAHALHNNR